MGDYQDTSSLADNLL